MTAELIASAMRNVRIPVALAALALAASPAVEARGTPRDGPGTAAENDDRTPSPAAAEPRITKLPSLLRSVDPVYPERAKAEGLEAVVILDIDIDATGTVDKASVATPSSAPGHGFEEAAMAAALQLQFAPAEADGLPVPARITYKYRFTLQSQPPAQDGPPPAKPAAVNFAGQLVERGTRAPLSGLRVSVFRTEGAAFEATSDEAGRFSFFDLDPGEWRVLVEDDAYYPFRTTESIVEGERVDARYHIERRAYNPYDVLVEASRERKEVTRRTISVAQAEKVPGTVGDALSVVLDLPSVARPFGDGGFFLVRGSSAEDTRIAVSGVDVPVAFHFFGARSVLPTGMVDAVDFYPGNFGPEYGRAIGGILDVRPKRLAPKRLGGYLDVSVFDTNAYVETPVGDDAAIAIAGRRSYVDLAVDAAVPDTAAVTFEIPPRYYDMQILGTWRPARAHRLEAFFFGSDDHVKVATESRTDLGPSIPLGDFESRSIFYRGLLRHEYAPSVGVHNELELSVGWDRANTIRPAQFDQDLRQTTIQAREKLRFALAPTLSLDLGVDWLEVRASGHLRSQGAILRKEGDAFYDQSSSETVQTEIGGAWAHYPATYVGAEWQPLAGLEVLPSLRLDYFGGAEQLTLDPRGTIRYGVTPTVTAKAAVGIYHQEPTIDELDEAWGNPTLEAERAIHYSLGAEVRPTGRLSIDVTAFYKQMDHMVARSSAVVERGGGLVPERYTNGGEGRVIGVDVFVRQQLSHNLFGWVAYTLSRAERRDPGASAWRRFDRDQTHILAAVASYRLPHNWELGARWRYVTGSPYTPIEGGVFDADSDVYRPLTGSINAGRIDAFHQLDVRLDKRWIYDGWMLDAYVELQNAYDRRNAEGYEYSFDYSQKEAASFVGITPMVGLRAEL